MTRPTLFTAFGLSCCFLGLIPALHTTPKADAHRLRKKHHVVLVQTPDDTVIVTPPLRHHRRHHLDDTTLVVAAPTVLVTKKHHRHHLGLQAEQPVDTAVVPVHVHHHLHFVDGPPPPIAREAAAAVSASTAVVLTDRVHTHNSDVIASQVPDAQGNTSGRTPADTSNAVTIVYATTPYSGFAANPGTHNFLRSAPDHTAAIIDRVPQNTSFEILAFASGGPARNGFYKVLLSDGTTGWTASSNVRFAN